MGTFHPESSVDGGWAIYTRDARRYRVPLRLGGWLEVDDPAESGDRWRFRLHDISWGGVCFELPVEFENIGPGARVGVMIGVGRTQVEGTLEVLHVSRDRELGRLSGGRFLPSSPDDESELDRLLERLEHLTSRGLWLAS
jgi:PilZ domain-containing protein